jgi:flagellar biosynthesis protein FlhG
MLDQAKRLREIASSDRKQKFTNRNRKSRRISVTSGKGGVGKSNFSLNLAVLAAKFGKKVLLIDADTNLANIDILLGLSPQYNISHVIAGIKRADEITIEGPEGITILPAASGSLEQLSGEARASDAVIADLNSLEEDFDVVIMDTGAGASKAVLEFLFFSDTITLITTPEPTAITDAYALVKLLSIDKPDADIWFLINYAANKREALEVFDKLASVINHFLNVRVNFLGFMPRDSSIPRAVHRQQPLIKLYPKSPAANQIKFMTRKLLNLDVVRSGKMSGLFSGLFRRSND